MHCIKLFHSTITTFQTRIKEGIDPPESSERAFEFEKNRKFLRDVVNGLISRRREGLGEERIPFIDFNQQCQRTKLAKSVFILIIWALYIHRLRVTQ